jgi:hypothetical protein
LVSGSRGTGEGLTTAFGIMTLASESFFSFLFSSFGEDFGYGFGICSACLLSFLGDEGTGSYFLAGTSFGSSTFVGAGFDSGTTGFASFGVSTTGFFSGKAGADSGASYFFGVSFAISYFFGSFFTSFTGAAGAIVGFYFYYDSFSFSGTFSFDLSPTLFSITYSLFFSS